ncbi:MAG: aspartate aminotransferase family protein [Crenarchaeota archaeon]|nr:aspartate aminotransferase family protein [Thermoproteota archaeon]
MISRDEIIELERSYLSQYYRKKNLVLVRGYGQYVWDIDGNMYLDCNTGYGVAFLGHCNKKIVNAVKEQVEKLLVCPMTFYNDARARFLKNFSRILPPKFGKIVLQNSGTEAVEAALKAARKYTKKRGILAFIGSFHGRTMGALSVTGNEKYRRPFEPLLPDVKFGRFNVVHDLDKLVTEDLAAVIVEPIQGEGGVNPATREFLKELRRLTEERGVLLIFDEVQTGFGRTGSIWAFENYGVEPDMFTVGKAVGGGLPIGALVIRKDLGDIFEPGEHGSTFGGNPLAMAAAAAACEVLLEDDVPGKAKEMGEYIMKKIENEISSSRYYLRVKGMGLMIGIELRREAEPFVDKLIEKRVLALSAGKTTLRLLPPYLINKRDVEEDLIPALIDVLEVKR